MVEARASSVCSRVGAFALTWLLVCRALAQPAAPVPAPAAPAVIDKPAPGSIEEALHYDPADPLSNLEAADVLDRGAARAKAARNVVPPARGCVVTQEPRRVWSKPGIAALAAFGDGYVLTGYTRSANASEQVFVVFVADSGKLEPVATLPLAVAHPAERVVAPGVAADPTRGVTVAYIDGAGELFAQRLRVGAAHGGGAALKLAQGVDTRFSPAVEHGKRGALVAYTQGSTPMRTFLVRFDPKGDVIDKLDVTPAAMGAAAPVFVHGAETPTLLTADPRNGLSPIARIRLDAEGKPTPGQVIAPVGMMSQPTQLAAAESTHGVYILYSGLGSAATSAIGLVRVAPVTGAGAPEAFVKGNAYGALHSAALAWRNAVVIAADAPLSAGKQPKHDLQFALIDGQGQGPTLHVAAPSGDATHVALTRGPHDQLGFSFSAPDGVYVGTLSCSL